MGHQKRQLGAVPHDKGVDFAVWAPFANDVTLLVSIEFQWREAPMVRDDSGVWSVENVDVKAGQAYKYKITTQDGTVLEKNDPYARQLTDSDNGSSVVVMRDFEWEAAKDFTPAPSEKTVIYELHIGTFNRPDASTPGTFATAIEKLDYLKDLGVTHVELMPVTSMAESQGWGYAPNYIFSVESSYGGRHGLLEFVKACHEKGLAVILDVVYNHFHPNSDLWQFDGWSENNRGGIYFFNDERGDTPWGGRPDYGRKEVRDFILDNVTMWLTEFRIDGLRIDSTIYMRNYQGLDHDPAHDIPEAWSLLAEMTARAKQINPHSLLIAEDNSSTPEIVASQKSGGAGFDAQWELGFPHVIRDALDITQNTDQARLDGIVWALQRQKRVVFSDSHDTAANGGARLNEEATPGNASSVYARHFALVANALTLSSAGIPMLLQGEEFMQGGAFSDWQMLDWNKTSQFSGIVLAHTHLIALRQNRYENTKGLTGQNTEIFHRDDTNTVLGFRRWETGGVGDDTLILINFSKSHFKDYSITLPIPGKWRVRFHSSWKGYSQDFRELPLDIVTTDEKGAASLPLPEYSVIIFSQD